MLSLSLLSLDIPASLNLIIDFTGNSMPIVLTMNGESFAVSVAHHRRRWSAL